MEIGVVLNTHQAIKSTAYANNSQRKKTSQLTLREPRAQSPAAPTGAWRQPPSPPSPRAPSAASTARTAATRSASMQTSSPGTPGWPSSSLAALERRPPPTMRPRAPTTPGTPGYASSTSAALRWPRHVLELELGESEAQAEGGVVVAGDQVDGPWRRHRLGWPLRIATS